MGCHLLGYGGSNLDPKNTRFCIKVFAGCRKPHSKAYKHLVGSSCRKSLIPWLTHLLRMNHRISQAKNTLSRHCTVICSWHRHGSHDNQICDLVKGRFKYLLPHFLLWGNSRCGHGGAKSLPSDTFTASPILIGQEQYAEGMLFRGAIFGSTNAQRLLAISFTHANKWERRKGLSLISRVEGSILKPSLPFFIHSLLEMLFLQNSTCRKRTRFSSVYVVSFTSAAQIAGTTDAFYPREKKNPYLHSRLSKIKRGIKNWPAASKIWLQLM